MNPGICAPRWRALLEARWRARLQEVTELSLAYHAAAAAAPAGPPGPADPQARDGGPGPLGTQRLLRHQLWCRELLCRAIVARRKLADVEEALGRLAAGTFGPASSARHRSRTACSPPCRRDATARAARPGAGPAPALSGRARA